MTDRCLATTWGGCFCFGSVFFCFLLPRGRCCCFFYVLVRTDVRYIYAIDSTAAITDRAPSRRVRHCPLDVNTDVKSCTPLISNGRGGENHSRHSALLTPPHAQRTSYSAIRNLMYRSHGPSASRLCPSAPSLRIFLNDFMNVCDSYHISFQSASLDVFLPCLRLFD